MKNKVLIIMILVILPSCSIMNKMMMNKMKKMSSEEKMEMMTRMMADENSFECSEMMERMSDMSLNDSLSMSQKASIMMPKCLENILTTVDDDIKAQYLLELVKVLVENGYDSIPIENKSYFKEEMINTIQRLE